MNTIADLKQHCLNRMNLAHELQEGAKAAGASITEASYRGEIRAYDDIHCKLVIFFKEESQQNSRSKD